MLIYLPILICILGLIIYLATDHAKTAEVGRIAFWVGLIISLFRWS